MQDILFTSHTAAELDRLVSEAAPDRVFILTDTTTRQYCLPLIAQSQTAAAAQILSIAPTDAAKSLNTLSDVWSALSNGKASRHSLLVNLGGGMVTDLGGFAAATFKRGIPFINIPTTLLSMVDAAVGGKTGINFNGLKNEIGSFCESSSVVIDTSFLRTLDTANFRSGFAEMLKHALLEDESMWADHLGFDLNSPDLTHLQKLVSQSVHTKKRIVTEDPHEQGFRKALNLGHTAGHAFESLALEHGNPVLHGYAVAWGLICELYLSAVHAGFPVTQMRQTATFIREAYGACRITCDDYPKLYELMLHDKKNAGGIINFTLLGGIGNILLNQHLTREAVYESLDFLREG